MGTRVYFYSINDMDFDCNYVFCFLLNIELRMFIRYVPEFDGCNTIDLSATRTIITKVIQNENFSK